jgi:assimilatory nitrate reductase catalytic subunit
MPAAVRTTCPYCGVGCGVLASLQGEEVRIDGDPQHPANFGRVCSKGAALADTLGLKGRLLGPRLRGAAATWEQALQFVAEGFARAISEAGPDSVAFYVSGQLLTEDYYVANKLMKGFIGSANIDTNSRLCMASAVVAHQRAFGEDIVPGCYEDFELADLIVLAGSNAAWCHPVLFRRIVEAKERRPQLRVVVIDPRRTASCDIADLHLPVRPGSDAWLFNGLLHHLQRAGATELKAAQLRGDGLAEALAAAADCADPQELAQRCGIDAERLLTFFSWFAATPRVVTAFSQGINQSTSGTDKANAILNCHLLTGRIGLPGAGPFSLTGQPNAMGGREVGGMASTLAAHVPLGEAMQAQVVQRFWDSPRIASRPGLKAVELFEALHEGRIRAIWIMGTNPAASLPNADRLRSGLKRCPLVVVSDCVADTETTRLAHVLLPAAAWGEKSGTVTNSERRISRQRAFLPLPGEARPDWWIVSEVARRLGFAQAFAYRGPEEIFAEHARLSGASNHGSRAFDISALGSLSAQQYEELEPIQWPVTSGQPAGMPRLLADGAYFHADRRARYVPVTPRAPAHACDSEFPFVLNTGRVRDQWHTMTRTGSAARLSEHQPEPFVDVHGQDALLHGLREGELARLQTRWGSMIARVATSGAVARGSAFVPIHWTATHSSDGRVGALIDAMVDPLSGEPEFKYTPLRLEPFVVDWYGFILSAVRLSELPVTWWTRIQGAGVTRYEIAGRGVPADWTVWARSLLGTDSTADFIEYRDVAAGAYRAAFLVDERLSAYVCVARAARLPERGWLARLFDGRALSDRERLAVLAERSRASASDSGPVLCACHGITRESVRDAIRRHGICDAREVGARLKAGTGCGSCVPEIKALIQQLAGQSA